MIVATVLMRDDEEIARELIEHHISQGIERFFVTLHRCSDSTRDIVRQFPQVMRVIEVEEEAHRQGSWVTHMAQEACRLKPDWIVHLDSDEFWEGFDWLETLGEDVGLVTVTQVCTHFPTPAMVYGAFRREQMPQYRLEPFRKVIHRPTTRIRVHQGNHSVDKHRGRAITTDRIRIHHYTIRSYGHFEKKVIQGGRAYAPSTNLPAGWSTHWRQWYQQWLDDPGSLRRIYDGLVVAASSQAANEKDGPGSGDSISHPYVGRAAR